MANIKCDLWCKHQDKEICKKIEIDIDDMQYIPEKSVPKCLDYDVNKAPCYGCEYSDSDKNICEIDGHSIDEDSTCTNGEFLMVY